MATLYEKEILEKIFLKILKNDYHNSETKLTGFLSMTGRLYKKDLMIVGRAVNGWIEGIDANCQDIKKIYEHIETIYRNAIGEKVCPMSWVTDCWDALEDEYKTSRSAFWRVIRRVVNDLKIADVNNNDSIWPSYLVWTNLYKISPDSGGNPNGILRKLQLESCIDLMLYELETYRPFKLLFLTGIGWAKLFIDALGMDISKDDGFQYVEGFGNTIVKNNKIGRYVVAKHPQGKKESIWVQEVIKAFELPC